MSLNTGDKKRDISSRIYDIAEQFDKCIVPQFESFSDFQKFSSFFNYMEFEEYFKNKIDENVISLLNVEKPKVMVYGIYNSGKSTLINSLCKEKVAEMADRPTTDQIAEYDRGDYILVDSPGVDAPIQHEEVTEEHINKCHIILFVISSKGMFEDRTNYIKMVNLIKREIPFVIILNDRGCQLEKDWTEEQKKRVKFEHDQDLKIIQYKIQENLARESCDQHITEQYEVIVLNARKAWLGVEKKKDILYEKSGIEFLEKRIKQLLTSEVSIGAVFKQPISNLKDCLNEVEKMITQILSGNLSEDFALRLHTLEQKKDNISEDLRILTRQAVQNHLDEVTNSYVNEDADIFESISTAIFMEVEERYVSKVNELLAFVDHNFKDLNLNLDCMYVSNLEFNPSNKTGSKMEFTTSEKEFEELPLEKTEEKKFLDLFKSRKKREKEKMERLEREAAYRNERAKYQVQENLRKKQEARQLASSDLDTLYREFNKIISDGLTEKYDELILQIQDIDQSNKQKLEVGKNIMNGVRELRKLIVIIENELN